MTATSSEPGARLAAPEPLRLVQRFVNTNDREGGRDMFADPKATARWFRDSDLPVSRLDSRAVARAIELREALRALLLANNAQPLDERQLAALDRIAERAGVVVRFDRTR